MASRNVNQIDATGRQVIANIVRLRGGMQYKDLAARLAEVGRPITPQGLKRIEVGERKVDVDDLMALAIVFGVSPLTLLMPESGSRDIPAHVTGYGHVMGSNVAWLWARADEPLELPETPDTSDGAPPEPDARAVAMFRLHARPAVIEPRSLDAISHSTRPADTTPAMRNLAVVKMSGQLIRGADGSIIGDNIPFEPETGDGANG